MVAGAASCASSAGEQPVEAGLWGGEHASLVVTDTGGRLELDCAHGEITSRLVADDEGAFTAPGYYVVEHGGPVRDGELEESRPASYAGRVDGRTLTLRLEVDGASHGPFVLVLGRAPRLTKCL